MKPDLDESLREGAALRLEQVKKVAVIGSGTMGPGMGLCFAKAGLGINFF
jgi:pyruvate/2-oxoglutarate dehydrogenase complex dihydrolipoamide dehydrogenase (E3) component